MSFPAAGPLPGPSAAQNGPVLPVCPQCGAVSSDGGDVCAFCDMSFELQDEARLAVPVAPGSTAAAEESATEEFATAVPSAEPEWRLEVARRLDAYRARRRHLHPDDSQAPLPFAEEPCELESESSFARPAPRPAPRPRKPERVEIRISQPELDFSAGDRYRVHPNSSHVPVADLVERRRAGTLDAMFVVLSDIGFLSLFRSLGGHISFSKYDVIVYTVTLFLFYAAYFILFTTFGSTTPGMQLRGLSVVNMDGGLPSIRQLLWRSFGYILSGATLSLGFLWALWDEDRLTWQDRISQTYLTSADPLYDAEPVDPDSGQHSLAHR